MWKILCLYIFGGKKGGGGSNHNPTEKCTANIFIANLQNILFFSLEECLLGGHKDCARILTFY